MATVPQLIPDANALLGLSPEELAKAVLTSAASMAQRGMFISAGIIGDDVLYGRGGDNQQAYVGGNREEISEALRTAWHWLEVNLIFIPADGVNGQNGWRVLSRRGRDLVQDEAAFDSFRQAAAFPRALLHPAIVERVWLDLARGDFQVAVFRAFRAVEEAVREAGGFPAEMVGVDLMRRAFHPTNGPLAKPADPMAEREALSALFAGALGSYKNPHSHRNVEIADAKEAQEMVLLASHLLSIVDARRADRNP